MTPLILNNKPVRLVLSGSTRIPVMEEDVIETEFYEIHADLSGCCDVTKAMELASLGEFRAVVGEGKSNVE